MGRDTARSNINNDNNNNNNNNNNNEDEQIDVEEPAVSDYVYISADIIPWATRGGAPQLSTALPRRPTERAKKNLKKKKKQKQQQQQSDPSADNHPQTEESEEAVFALRDLKANKEVGSG